MFKKIRRLCYVVRLLFSFGVDPRLVRTFVFACAVPTVSYWSPVVFCGLHSRDFAVLRRCLKLLSKCSRIQYNDMVECVTEKHFAACDRLTTNILEDPTHPLHCILAPCLVKRPTRRPATPLFARTSAYKNSLLPYLSRYLSEQGTISLFKKSVAHL